MSEQKRPADSVPRSAGRSAEHVNQTSTREPKKPVKLSNKFVAGLPPGQMWWTTIRGPRGSGCEAMLAGGSPSLSTTELIAPSGALRSAPSRDGPRKAARERVKELRTGRSTAVTTPPATSGSAGKCRRSRI